MPTTDPCAIPPAVINAMKRDCLSRIDPITESMRDPAFRAMATRFGADADSMINKAHEVRRRLMEQLPDEPSQDTQG